MEVSNNNNNINYPKISLYKNQINQKTQSKPNCSIETNYNSSDKSNASPILLDSCSINSYYINDIRKIFIKKAEKTKKKGILLKYINSSYFKRH